MAMVAGNDLYELNASQTIVELFSGMLGSWIQLGESQLANTPTKGIMPRFFGTARAGQWVVLF